MSRFMAFWLVLAAGFGVAFAAVADNRVPVVKLNSDDVWRPGEGNYVGDFNRWVWHNFNGPNQAVVITQAALSAGDATTFERSREAFSVPMTVDQPRLRDFAFARILFRRRWAIAPGTYENLDGLGPTYNRVSCSGCHLKDGRGQPPASPDQPMESMLIRLSVPGVAGDGGPAPHPVYGSQLQDKGVAGVPSEGRVTIRYREIEGTFADGESYRLRAPVYTFSDLQHGPLGDDVLFSPRVAPAIFGVGLLEAIDEAVIEAGADPDDADGDGISGRVNRVWDAVSGETRIGRFGWKANTASLTAQVAAAAFADIGITTSIYPANNCPPAQSACLDAPNGGIPELDDQGLRKLVLYTQLLAVPARRGVDDPLVRRGESLFAASGCVACHTASLKTRADAIFPELADQTIRPYTDLLLHDMGEGLADGRPDFEASGSEWRTPPLWGIGLVDRVNMHDFFLHDGRARGFMEAVLWHGGEAEAARDSVLAMAKADRDALIAFLASL